VVKLTPKQEKFAKAIAYEGMRNTDAYRSAYNVENMSDNAVYVEACKLAQNPKIAQRIKEIAAELDSPKIMNATKRREKLTELTESEDPNVVMKAIDLLNKMDGEYIQKIEAEVTNAISINIELSDD
jgi:phage terminase small subunit